MSVRRLSNSFISTQGRGKSSTLLAGYSPAIYEMDLIERITVGSGGASSIEFTDIPNTYRSLQLRASLRTSDTGSGPSTLIRMNGVTTSSYSTNEFVLAANGTRYTFSYASGTRAWAPAVVGNNDSTAGFFTFFILELPDYASTVKNKTYISYGGGRSNSSTGHTAQNSGMLLSTDPVTSLLIFPDSGGTYAQYSAVSLYGVR